MTQKLVKITSPSEMNKVLLGHYHKASFIACAEQYGAMKYFKTSISNFKELVEEWDDVWCFIENDVYYITCTSKKSKLFKFGLSNNKHIRYNSIGEYLNSFKRSIDTSINTSNETVEFIDVNKFTSMNKEFPKPKSKVVADSYDDVLS